MPAANEIYGRVVFVHHGFDEDKVLVRRVQNVLKIFDYFHHISFCVAISAKHIGELGVAPVGDVVVLGISTQDCPFNRVALVVYDENERSQVVAQIVEISCAVSWSEPSPVNSTWRRLGAARSVPSNAPVA